MIEFMRFCFRSGNSPSSTQAMSLSAGQLGNSHDPRTGSRSVLMR
jgi:hypothetical protein